jgi:chromosome segregation ATPase
MNKIEIELKMVELKDQYLQLQHNLEKLEFVNGNLAPLEKRLFEIEKELSSLNQELRELAKEKVNS